jgi:hypothetical protein
VVSGTAHQADISEQEMACNEAMQDSVSGERLRLSKAEEKDAPAELKSNHA